jgi:hypothetical protein
MSATVEEQITAVATDVSLIVPHVHSVAAYIGQVSAEGRSIVRPEIATKIAEIPPQVGAIAAQILLVRAQVLPVCPDVRSVCVPAGRSDVRSQTGAGDRSSGDQSHHNFSHHDTSPDYEPRQPPHYALAH